MRAFFFCIIIFFYFFTLTVILTTTPSFALEEQQQQQEQEESSRRTETEQLFLLWFGPFTPTPGTSDDSTSPLNFLSGLWYAINSNNQVPSFSEFQKQFSSNSNLNKENDNNNPNQQHHQFASRAYMLAAQKYINEVLVNVSIPMFNKEREGERKLEDWSDIVKQLKPKRKIVDNNDDNNVDNNDDNNVDNNVDVDFEVRFVGAAHHGRVGTAALPKKTRVENFLPPTHIAEVFASHRIASGIAPLSPNEPERWVHLQPDPTRLFVVCQSTPDQWALPFPLHSKALTSLCPPASSLSNSNSNENENEENQEEEENFHARVGRIQVIETDRAPITWKRRMMQMDEIWVPTEFHKKAFSRQEDWSQGSIPVEKLRVIPEPIDTELWRRDDLVFQQEYFSLLNNSLPSASSFSKDFLFENEEDDDNLETTTTENNENHGENDAETKLNQKIFEKMSKTNPWHYFPWRCKLRNDEISKKSMDLLQLIGMLPQNYKMEQEFMSRHVPTTKSSRHDFFSSFIITQNQEQLEFEIPKFSANDFVVRTPQQFLERCASNNNHKKGTTAKTKLLMSSFQWSQSTGWDVTVRSFLESFGGELKTTISSTTENSSSSSSSVVEYAETCLMLRTGDFAPQEPFALDLQRTLEFYVNFLYADNFSSTNSSVEEDEKYETEINITHQQFLQDQEYNSELQKQIPVLPPDVDETGPDEDVRLQEWEELQMKIFKKFGPPHPPFVADRVSAAKMAMIQRKQMEKDFFENNEDDGGDGEKKRKSYFKLCKEFCVSEEEETDDIITCDSCQQLLLVEEENNNNTKKSDAAVKFWRRFMRWRIEMTQKFKYSEENNNKNNKFKFKKKSFLLPPIVILRGNMVMTQYRELISHVDAVVFPTRGEGFGRPVLEAMSLAVPSIVTNWSGPTAFSRPEFSFLIPIDEKTQLSDVPAEGSGFSTASTNFAGHKWAEPSCVDVRNLMREVVLESSDEKLKKMGALARLFTVENLDSSIVGHRVLIAVNEVSKKKKLRRKNKNKK